ncbi:hypothetical protein FM076_09665 [Streptomyces albus subsp. chlorinus]|nr:hypothetical protein [Streptomyces albus subsp. chlorinus]
MPTEAPWVRPDGAMRLTTHTGYQWWAVLEDLRTSAQQKRQSSESARHQRDACAGDVLVSRMRIRVSRDSGRSWTRPRSLRVDDRPETNWRWPRCRCVLCRPGGEERRG